MKLNIFSMVIVAFMMLNTVSAQSIRKDYREMTDDEKEAYVDVLYDLWDNGNGVIEDFVDDHVNFQNTAHGDERFLPWHRIFIEEFEDEVQNVNPYLVIPYWDWRDDNSSNPEWNDQDFLGQFNAAFNLGRCQNFGCISGGFLPTHSQINNLLSLTSFRTGGNSSNGFGGGNAPSTSSRGDLEVLHGGPHVWVGGDMSQVPTSPRDPIFYFHHAMVDMIWQIWDGTSTFSSTNLSMSPYGTLDPHDYVDSRTLKVWYAEDGEVLLDQYDTDGTEEYRYTGIINAEDNFVVKNTSDVTFIAGNKITLGPGFKVESGAEFYADVDTDVGNILSKQVGGTEEPLVESTNTPEDYSLSQNYPNPFNPVTVIRYEVPITSRVELAVFDLLGRKVATLVDGQVSAGRQEVRFDASNLSSGIYIYRIRANDFVQTKQMTLIK